MPRHDAHFAPPRLMVSGPSRSAGKTTTCIGLIRAFRNRGFTVQPYKKGPDYIDPMWLSAAAGRDCRNLDFFMMGKKNIAAIFDETAYDADLAIIEGNLSLHDGLDLEGADSSAALARELTAPILFVVDASRMNRGVAPLLLGYKNFDPLTTPAAVILNRVASPRHEDKLRTTIERYVGLDVVGVIPKDPQILGVTERHLGLIPFAEDPALGGKVEKIAELLSRSIDLDRVWEIARSAPKRPIPPPDPPKLPAPILRIGVAKDRAFTFHYPENFRALRMAGAELVFFSPLEDSALPPIDALYLGGGFPEFFMTEIEENRSMRESIREALEGGLPYHAECGGLVYLSGSLTCNGVTSAMAGFLPLDTIMTDRPQGLGYMTLAPTGIAPFCTDQSETAAHEFHHTRVVNAPSALDYIWNVTRGSGIITGKDGLLYRNGIASYAHLNHYGAPRWAQDFVTFALKK